MLDNESTDLEYGCRCRVNNTTIFGTFYGYDKKGRALFLDEELGTLKRLPKKSIVRTYERLR